MIAANILPILVDLAVLAHLHVKRAKNLIQVIYVYFFLKF